MKHFLFSLLTLSLFSSNSVCAQSKYNRLSFEFATGYAKPLNTYQKNLNSDFSSFKHLEFGARYMITEKFGVRLNYANDRFKNYPNGYFGSNFSRVGVSGVYNIGKSFGLDTSTRNTIGLLAHAGVGYTRLKPINRDAEQIGALVLGITPQVKISERIAFFADVSYTANFKQHYRYDGSLISTDYEPTVGSHVTASVGLMFYLGSQRYHSDWY